MSEISIRVTGRAGRITLTRPEALNALTRGMVREVSAALAAWRDDPEIALVLLDAEGERAFCAGGDLQEMYRTGRAGDYSYGRAFFVEEYRMNAAIAEYPKPWVTFAQGFTMGGGVGVGLHGSHRVVGETSRIAMPECAVGLVPDVGGSLLLGRAPGRLGEYLGLTGARMGPGDAIHAGFADSFVPEAEWGALKAALERDGDLRAIAAAARDAPESRIARDADAINHVFAHATVQEIAVALEAMASDWARETRAALDRQCPLSMACALRMIRQARRDDSMRLALRGEYRFTSRCMEMGDFLEGIRAQVVDKDRNPRWSHTVGSVTQADVDRLLAPLGPDELTF